jgi:hypothetical protein
VIFLENQSDSKTQSKTAKVSAKKQASLEQQCKQADDHLTKLSYYELLKTVTHCPNINIVDSSNLKEKSLPLLTAEEEEHLA